MKIKQSEIPTYYALCIRNECQRAQVCLHQIAYELVKDKDEYLKIINRNRCTCDDTCPYFADSKPVKFAKGFSQMQTKMFPAQYSTFMNTLRDLWGRTPYFERHRGVRLLPPDEQQVIRDLLKKIGVTEELAFDGYEKQTNWI